MAVTRVSTDGLADSAVNSAKIGVDVITDADLANNSVTVNEISDNAVSSAKLAAGASLANIGAGTIAGDKLCLLYTSPSPRDLYRSRMPSSA